MAEVKIYCGDRSNLPGGQGYSRFGTRNECLKCGFGAAMYKYRWEPADNQPMPPRRQRQGCLRSQQHAQGMVRGDQFVRRGALSQPPSPLTPPSSPPQDLSPPFPRYPLDNHVLPQRREYTRTKFIVAVSVWLIACTVAFILLYKFPPSVATKIENKNKVIKWDTFMGIYTLIFIGVTAIAVFSYSVIRTYGVR